MVDPPSILCVFLGLLFIAGRGPIIFAPRATLRFFDRLISTDAGIRGIGAVLAPLAVALIVIPLGEGAVAGILHALGWLWAAGTLLLLAAPDSYRRIARGVLGYFESSVGEATARVLGLVAVAIGIGLIYYGLYVV